MGDPFELKVTYYDNQWGMLFSEIVDADDDNAWMALGLQPISPCPNQLVKDPNVQAEAVAHELDLHTKED